MTFFKLTFYYVSEIIDPTPKLYKILRTIDLYIYLISFDLYKYFTEGLPIKLYYLLEKARTICRFTRFIQSYLFISIVHVLCLLFRNLGFYDKDYDETKQYKNDRLLPVYTQMLQCVILYFTFKVSKPIEPGSSDSPNLFSLFLFSTIHSRLGRRTDPESRDPTNLGTNHPPALQRHV